jgi:glucose-1-phosphate adenylyltransferase
MKKKVVGMVLVGGRGARLGAITQHTAKPAVQFAGKYRLIDFTLSNLSNSGIDTVGLVTQYEPHELMQYIGHGATWDLDVDYGGIHFLTPYTSSDGQYWQKGTAHAIMQHFYFIDQYDPDYVLILSGDHIYKMNYQKLVDMHKKSRAEMTIAAFQVKTDASRYGIITTDVNGYVKDFEEKPKNPKSDLASMGVYLFNRETLRKLLAEVTDSKVDFGHDIIPQAIEMNVKIAVYSHKGYFRDVGTIDSLYEANMEQIDAPSKLRLKEYANLPVYTRSSNLPPHHIARQCIVVDSIISDGCLILGDVRHSVLSSNLLIDNGALVIDCVLHQHVTVGKGSFIRNLIVTSGTTIPPYTHLNPDKVMVVTQDFFKEEKDNE